MKKELKMLSIKMKRMTASGLLVLMAFVQIANAAPAELSQPLENQQAVTNLEQQTQKVLEPNQLPSGSVFTGDSALSIPASKDVVAIKKEAVELKETLPEKIQPPVVNPLTEIKMTDGRIFTHNPLNKTGFVKEGVIKENYKEVSFVEAMRCTLAVADEPSTCTAIEYGLVPGALKGLGQMIGAYTKQEGDTIKTYHIYGTPTTTEILMTDGSTLYRNAADPTTGYVLKNGIKTEYKNIAAVLKSAQSCPVSGGECEELAVPAVAFILAPGQVSIGDYSQTTREGDQFVTRNFFVVGTVVTPLASNQIVLASGEVLTILEGNTGAIKNGPVTKNYRQLSFQKAMSCTIAVADEPSSCAVIDYGLVPGALEKLGQMIGSFTKQDGNRIVTFHVYGIPTTTEITMDGGRLFTLSHVVSNTGWVGTGNTTEHFESVSILQTQKMTCPSNPMIGMPCSMQVFDYTVPKGFKSIGTYSVKAGDTKTSYVIIGKPVTPTAGPAPEIMAGVNRGLPVDLKKAVIPVAAPADAALLAAKIKAQAAYWGSAIPASIYQQAIEQKKKKR